MIIPHISPAEVERRSLLADHLIRHKRLPPKGQRDVASLRRLLGASAPQASARQRTAAASSSPLAWEPGDGIRTADLEGDPYVSAEDLASWLLSVDPADAEDSTRAARRFDALTPMQRATLKRTNRQAYDAARAAWNAVHGHEEIEHGPDIRRREREERRRELAKVPPTPRAERYEQLSGSERHVLKALDPAAFDRLRNDWIARGEPAE